MALSLPLVKSFTFLNYGAVSGTLSIFNPNVDNLSERWEISYFSTHAILTVEQHVLDYDLRTLLLLGLGLLGLVAYRRQLLRGQR